MKTSMLWSTVLLLFLLPAFVFAQPVLQKRDPKIVKMISEVSHEKIEANIRKLVSFHTRHSLSDTVSTEKGIGAARRWIKAQFDEYAQESDGRLQAEFDPFWVEAGRRIQQRVRMKNVLAILRGSDPNTTQRFVVSGHYDSRVSGSMDAESFAPGANDDASGTAVVMELARVMSKQSFAATIIFAAVPGEEQGLFGSSHLAARAKEEGWHLPAMITNDIVGNSQSSGTNLKDNARLRVFSEGIPDTDTEQQIRTRRTIGGMNDGPARQLARYAEEVGERYVDQMDVVLIYRRDRFGRGGDHTPFSRVGYAAVRFTEMNENFIRQHQDIRTEDGVHYGDLPDYVDFKYIANVAKINLAILANLASAPASPDSVAIVTRGGLRNGTTLRWTTPGGPAPAGYYVLMRTTTSPQWERKFDVGNVTMTSLPYSKDNYIFAVQSVDSDGHESLPVYPFPQQRRRRPR